ncbi:hypothetical protein A2326_00080 [candidate division WWE3 bacterium RIFOXYB2_FULL_41_6]|nr:MAG: hypothetical protein A2326_00080 [candidate division WWE3 bacterium RIFOXYB2_FULL_41_6]
MKKIIATIILAASAGTAYAEIDLARYGFTQKQITASISGISTVGKATDVKMSQVNTVKKVKDLAAEYFFQSDVKVLLGEVTNAGNLYGYVKVKYSGKKWATVKKYLAASVSIEGGIPDSPQAIKSAKENVLQQFKNETELKVIEIDDGICGGQGPSFIVDVMVKGVAKSIKTYGILASEISSNSPSFMASDECRE